MSKTHRPPFKPLLTLKISGTNKAGPTELCTVIVQRPIRMYNEIFRKIVKKFEHPQNQANDISIERYWWELSKKRKFLLKLSEGIKRYGHLWGTVAYLVDFTMTTLICSNHVIMVAYLKQKKVSYAFTLNFRKGCQISKNKLKICQTYGRTHLSRVLKDPSPCLNKVNTNLTIDDHAKDGGPRIVWPSCSFYHDPLRR